VSHDSEHEHAGVADEARRRAREAEARARTEAERMAAMTETGDMKKEMLRQTGVKRRGLPESRPSVRGDYRQVKLGS
jgi:hypothetical protein